MQTLRLLITYLFFMLAFFAEAQHSPLLSQYMTNTLVVNPAYTGNRNVFTANASYRNQWVGFDGAPVMQVVSAHAPLKNQRIALGILFNNEKIGVSRRTALSGSFAYRIPMGSANLSFGLSAGVDLLSSNYTNLSTAEINDLAFQENLKGNLTPQFGAGVYYNTNKYFVGVSMPSLMSRNYNIENERFNISNNFTVSTFLVHGGYVWEINDNFKLKPSALFRISPAGNHQFDINAQVMYNDRFGLGVSYRNRDALAALIDFRVNSQFRIAYTYEYAISIFRHYTSGSHEIGLQYEFGFKVKSVDPRFF